MNPDEVHTGIVASEHPWSYRMFYIKEETFRHILPEKSILPFFRGLCFENKYWFERLHTLHCLLERNVDTVEQQSQFIQILSSFSKAYGKVSSLVGSGKEPKAISMTKSYLNANFRQNVSINDLVKITQLSRAYLIRSFQRFVGMPPYSYLIQIRIKHAKKC
jgi:YesN/AraC family two-component response regulator